MMRFIIFFISLFLTSPLYAVLDFYKNLNQSFVKTVEFPLAKNSKIYYGHPQVGFFEAINSKFANKKMKVEYTPPTYKYPTQFYIFEQQKYIKVFEVQNQSPLPPSFKLFQIEVTGNFSDPFYLIGTALPRSRFKNYNNTELTADLPMKNKTRFSFPMIVNKLGEIVWVYIPIDKGIPPVNYPVIEPIGPGRYGLLLGSMTSTFEAFDWKGKSEYLIRTKEFNPSQPMHHDFIAFRENSFITFGLSASNYGTKKSYVSSTIMRVLIKEGKIQVLKDYGQEFNPMQTPWDEEKGEDDEFFYHWDKPLADHDFLHANGLRTSDAGHLISFRHLSKVLLVEKNTLKPIWSVGPTKDNDFVATGESAFKFQHSPILDKDQNLIIFDNNPKTRESRILALKLEGKKATKIWEFPKNSPFYSKDRGSVMMNTNNNAIALFVSPQYEKKPFATHTRNDYILEYDPRQDKELGRMKITYYAKSAGYRAEPLLTIGKDPLVKMNP